MVVVTCGVGKGQQRGGVGFVGEVKMIGCSRGLMVSPSLRALDWVVVLRVQVPVYDLLLIKFYMDKCFHLCLCAVWVP